jgi:hypothetical protein
MKGPDPHSAAVHKITGPDPGGHKTYENPTDPDPDPERWLELQIRGFKTYSKKKMSKKTHESKGRRFLKNYLNEISKRTTGQICTYGNEPQTDAPPPPPLMCSLACIAGTGGIILVAPSLYDTRSPIDILVSKVLKGRCHEIFNFFRFHVLVLHRP